MIPWYYFHQYHVLDAHACVIDAWCMMQRVTHWLVFLLCGLLTFAYLSKVLVRKYFLISAGVLVHNYTQVLCMLSILVCNKFHSSVLHHYLDGHTFTYHYHH